MAAGVLAPAQRAELVAYRDGLNPAAIDRQIADLQATLLKLAKDKTEQLYLASFPSALPRHPQKHPDQGLLTPKFRGHFYLMHGPSFAGILT